MKMSSLLSDLLDKSSNLKPIPGKREERWRFSPLDTYLQKEYKTVSDTHATLPQRSGEDYWIFFKDSKVLELELPPSVHVRHGQNSLELNFFEDISVYLHMDHSKATFVDFSLNIIIKEHVNVHLYHTYESGSQGFFLHNENIKLEPYSELFRTQIQDLSPTAVLILQSNIHLDNNTLLKDFALLKEGEYVHNLVHVDMHYQSEVDITSLLLSHNQQRHIFSCDINHLADRSKSTLLSKQVIRNHSICVFDANTKIEQGTKGTEAKQTSRALLLDESAQVHSMPHLEIYSDDLTASHGSTVGELDMQSIAYIRSRGISEEKAREILINAFISDTLENINDAEHKIRVEKLLGASDETE